MNTQCLSWSTKMRTGTDIHILFLTLAKLVYYSGEIVLPLLVTAGQYAYSNYNK